MTPIVKIPIVKMTQLLKMTPIIKIPINFDKIPIVNPKIVKMPIKIIPLPFDSRFEKVPKCIDCKFNVQADDFPICTKFKYVSVMNDYRNFNYYMDSITCREDTDLCGPSGDYFEVK